MLYAKPSPISLKMAAEPTYLLAVAALDGAEQLVGDQPRSSPRLSTASAIGKSSKKAASTVGAGAGKNAAGKQPVRGGGGGDDGVKHPIREWKRQIGTARRLLMQDVRAAVDSVNPVLRYCWVFYNTELDKLEVFMPWSASAHSQPLRFIACRRTPTLSRPPPALQARREH